MRPHLQYLRYVLLHKLYVALGGLAIMRATGWSWRLAWRLLVHDLSKFRPSEWRPYVATFYGPPTAHHQERKAAFERAWLLHQHRNDHHWQHWLLQQDDGRRLVLLPPRWVADEMLADWIGAGTKILTRPSLGTCVAETLTWYVQNAATMQLRTLTRLHIETTLAELYHRATGEVGEFRTGLVAVSIPVPRGHG